MVRDNVVKRELRAHGKAMLGENHVSKHKEWSRGEVEILIWQSDKTVLLAGSLLSRRLYLDVASLSARKKSLEMMIYLAI